MRQVVYIACYCRACRGRASKYCGGKIAFLGKNMEGMEKGLEILWEALPSLPRLAELSSEGLGKDGFFQELDLLEEALGCVTDQLLPGKKAVEDVDGLFLLWERGNTQKLFLVYLGKNCA